MACASANASFEANPDNARAAFSSTPAVELPVAPMVRMFLSQMRSPSLVSTSSHGLGVAVWQWREVVALVWRANSIGAEKAGSDDHWVEGSIDMAAGEDAGGGGWAGAAAANGIRRGVGE